MDETLREPLLLFSQQVEMEACLEGIRARTHVPFRAERVGHGRDASHRTTHLLGEGEPPSVVVSLGSAGWLHLTDPPSLSAWITEAKSESGRVLRTSVGVPTSMVEELGFFRARLITVRTPVLDYERGQQLAVELGADLVDSEGYPIARACFSRNVPCAVVRGMLELNRSSSVQQHRPKIEAAMRVVGRSVVPLLQYLDGREQERVERLRRHQ